MKLHTMAEKLKKNNDNYLEYYNRGIKIKIKYSDLFKEVLQTISFIKNAGIKPNERIGILSDNAYEWILIDLASLFVGFTLVALHTKIFERKLETVCRKYEIKLLFIQEKYIGKNNSATINIFPLESLLDAIKKENEAELEPFSFDDNNCFTFVFTSGTTGEPKCLGLRVKAIEHTIQVSSKEFQFTKHDKTIIFLPLSVFTSRLYIYGAFLLGFDVTITVPEMVLNALRIYQPTILQAVPNFFESIYNAFYQQIRSSIIKHFFYNLYISIHRLLPSFINHALHGILYNEVISYFGGKMRIMITGTAPISARVLEFYKMVGIDLYESYGLNETGVLALNSVGKSKIGSVGMPLDGFDIMVEDKNHIAIKSDYCWSSGYIGADKKVNVQVFREDGTIATGDIGYFDNDGFLYLNGRITEIITLSNGQKTHPIIIEKHLNDSPLIKQSMIIGNNKSYLVAIIVTNDNETTYKQIREEIKKANKNLFDYLQVKNFIIAKEPFSLENNLLSNNLKLNRQKIYNKYKKKINDLYN